MGPVKLRLAAVAVALAVAAPAQAAPPGVTARAYVVENAATGEVLAGRAARRSVPIASITKLMTVLVTLERAKPTDVVTVTAAAASVGESSIRLRVGERLSVRELVEAALIQSANDAADALADHVGGGNRAVFVALMNRRARELGLRETHFVRPDGLDAFGHVSSARDVTLLARVLMHRPLVRAIVRRSTARISGGRTLHTWNDLLATFPSLLGVKTGHTSAAGWCQVAAVQGRGYTIYATLLGSPSRAQRNRDLAALLSWGLDRYRLVPVVERHRVYARAETGWGLARLPLLARAPLLSAVRVDSTVTERVVAPDVVRLPVRRGQRLGVVRVYARGRMIGERPLVAARAVATPGMRKRVAWYAGRTAHHLIGLVS